MTFVLFFDSMIVIHEMEGGTCVEEKETCVEEEGGGEADR